MTQFISLDEAAEQLGVSKDRLNELREAGVLRAFKDGASWKFKSDEIERAIEDPSLLAPPMASDLDLNLLEEPSDPADSILVSDVEVGNDFGRPPSTIIGKSEISKGDSDLELQLDNESSSGASDVRLASPASDVLSSSTSSSHILGEAEEEPLPIPESPDPSAKFEDLDELEIDLETESSRILSASDIGKLATGEGASELDLMESDLQLSGSAIDPTPISDSVQEDDGDLVLGEGGSDITLSAGDSGINLIDASDSGIALDDISLELGGSGIEPLELIGDSEEMLVLDDSPEDVGELQAEDAFSLTPLSGMEDPDDSGSQVIALDSAMDLSDPMMGGAVMLEPAEDSLSGIGVGPGFGSPAAAMGGGATAAPMVADTTFSGLIIGLMILCLLVLSLIGIMVFDLLRSIQSWSEPYSFTSQLLEVFNFFN